MFDLDMLDAEYIGADAPSLDAVRAGRGVIKKGMSGDAVRYVQAIVGDESDGVFSPKTEAAVKAFQRANSLKDDGIVGRETMAALDKAAGIEVTVIREYAPSETTRPASSASSPGGARGSASVIEPVGYEQTEALTRRNQIIAGVLGAIALLGIGVAVTR